VRRLILLAVLACTLLATPAYAQPAYAQPAYAEPTSHSVPPPAPKPTARAKSPNAPDPHPPAGGIGPFGELVGGPRLHSRGLVLPASAEPLPRGLTATAWVLADLDTGDVLAARDPHGRYQPASILKVLTAATLLPLLPGDRVITVSQNAANAEGSAVGVVAGGRYTVDVLFTGTLLMSGNDTAVALAEAAGGVARTVALMNQTALRLGAYDTFAQTPSGLDGWQQLTSAYDMAIILRAALNMPRFVAYDRRLTGSLPAQNVHGHKYGSVWLGNQSAQFLTTVPGALVSKTGFTDAASHTFLCAAQRGEHRLGVVFLRARRYRVDQWQQASKLLDWGFALPRGTSVGHLDAAATTPADRNAPTGTARHNPGSAAARPHRGSPPWTIIAVLIVAAGAGVIWLSGRRSTGHHRGAAGRR
jgi:serine-type D-Ala-D-Ala carboxypeptidase (penicillin-binding protein 5/6)